MTAHMSLILLVFLLLAAILAELGWRLSRPHHGRHIPPRGLPVPTPQPIDSTDRLPAIRVAHGDYQPGSNAAAAVWQPRAAPLSLEVVNWRLAELHAAQPHLFADDWADDLAASFCHEIDELYEIHVRDLAVDVLASEVLESA